LGVERNFHTAIAWIITLSLFYHNLDQSDPSTLKNLCVGNKYRLDCEIGTVNVYLGIKRKVYL